MIVSLLIVSTINSDEGVGSPKLLLLTGGSGVVRLRGQAKSMYSAVEMVAGIALIMARNGHIWAIRSPN